MDRVLPTVTPPATVTDGFGQRLIGVDSETGEQVELLEFAPGIVEHTAFVTALAERVARLASVRHASYSHLRRLDRPASDRLQLLSDVTPGWRLSELLEESTAANIPVDISTVIALLRQLLPAVALFSRHNRENAIGTLSPHRLIVTPQARLVIAEHAFGPAIEKLDLDRDTLWRDFRVAMPPGAGPVRANPRADANGIGIVALTLLIGRPLELDEFPDALAALVDNAQEHRGGEASPISTPFKNWLKRALQFEGTNAFQTPSEAQLAFESVLASDRSYVTSSPVLANWVNEIGGTIDIKRKPVPPPPPPEPEPALEPEQSEPEPHEAAQAEPERAQQPEPVILRSNGEVAEPSISEPELIAVSEPAPEPEVVAAGPEPVEEVEVPEAEPVAATPAIEEVEIPLDDPEPVAAAPAAEAEPISEPEPEPVPESEEVAEPRPAFTREQLEEDPIARALLNYQPQLDPPEAEPEPVPAAEPEPEPVAEPEPEPVAEPVAEVIAEPQDAIEEVEEELQQEPDAEPEEEPQPVAAQYESPVAAYQAPPRYDEPATHAQYEQPQYEQPQYEQPHDEQPHDEQQQDVVAEPAADEPAYEAPSYDTQPAAAVPEVPSAVEAPYAPESKSPFSSPIVLGLAGVVVVLIAVMGWLLTRDGGGAGMREGEGELVVQSRPEGAQVKIDGAVRGATPLTVRLDAGAHVMEVQSGKSEPRVIPLMITAGVQTSQYVELQGVAKTGGLQIRSEPAGARITIDGRPRGTTPATITDLTPGDHTVVLESGGRKVTQAVKIEAGITAQLVVPMRR